MTSANPAPNLSNWPNNATNWPCAPTLDYSCTGGGYAGQDSWGYAAKASTNKDGKKHNCTAYVAYRLEQDGVTNPGALGDAKFWGTAAAAKGITVDQTPSVGAVAQWTSGDSGHVGYVDAVNTDGSIVVSSDNFYDRAGRWYGGYTQTVRIPKGAAVWPANFIHFKPKYGTPKITSVKFRDQGVLLTFTAPTMPSGVTIRSYHWQAIDTDGRWLWSSDLDGAQSSPVFIPYPCGGCGYQLSASFDGGQTKWSNAVAATPVTAAPKISSVKFRDGGVLATFTPPAMPSGLTIRGYVWQAIDANTNTELWNGWADGAQSSPMFIPFNCGDGTSCKYRIFAAFDGGQTKWSNAVATAGITTAPKISSVKFRDGGVLATFTPPAMPSGLTIRGYTWQAIDANTNTELWNGWADGAQSSPMFIPYLCSEFTSCKYQIVAAFDGGKTGWSNTVATAGINSPVLNLVIRQQDAGKTTLIASPPTLPPGVTVRGYAWEASDTSNGQLLQSGYTQGASPLSIDYACAPEQACKYRVRATIDGGASPWSNSANG